MMILSLGEKNISEKRLREIAFYKHAPIVMYLETKPRNAIPKPTGKMKNIYLQ